MSFEISKQAAARAAVDLVEDGMIVGLGTGSTSLIMVGLLAERGLKIQAVATSEAMAAEARRQGIALVDEYPNFQRVDLTLDGADEADGEGRLIKGGGGALLREKLVAIASTRLIIMIDESKRVSKLGENWPVPVEVVPFGWARLHKRIEELGAEVKLRERGGKPFRTDQGNYIFDCRFGPMEQPEKIHAALIQLTGVVETGLFLGLTNTLVTGTESGEAHMQHFYPTPPDYLR
ncbi:MAG: ribose-5-phosphate isomerase RpiA [Candidatus Eremiobacteraeota bacterium]|nr:ribose-5-phosphate isomerase RpiA [Candidatus Eremiobacteraeota bacterium]MCW5868956.1 ribose-5-phosphate isomerase RpiA [Candidatus Eremiobacteraeota bacterium]